MVFEPSYTSILSIYITDVKVAKKYGEKLQKKHPQTGVSSNVKAAVLICN